MGLGEARARLDPGGGSPVQGRAAGQWDGGGVGIGTPEPAFQTSVFECGLEIGVWARLWGGA